MIRARSIIFACLTAAAAPVFAEDAQSDAVEASPFPLPEVLVTARQIDAPRSLIVREATAQDMTAWNAHTAGDALTYVPGVNVLYGGTSGDARVWIRGFRERDLLILFDGVPIMQNFEGGLDLNEIATQNVATIQVLKSAPSVIYGTNGQGGVIDILPNTGLVDKLFSGRVETGSDDRRLVSARVGGGNDNVSFSLSGQHQEADDYSLSDNFDPRLNQPSGDRVNSDFERDSVMFHLDALQTPIGHTSMFVNFTDAEKGLPVEAGVDDPDFERLTKSRRKTLGLSNHFAAIPLSMTVFYNDYDSKLTVYTDASYSVVDEVEKADDYSYGGRLYSTLETSDNNSLVLAGGAQTDVFKADGVLESGDKAELTTYTLAVEDQFWITERMSLAAGLIYSYFDPTESGGSTDDFSPQAALAWQATPDLRFHASAAQRTRYPKMRELYRRRWGNPDLQPQSTDNYEVGVAYSITPALTGDFSVYRSDIDDLIERPNRQSTYMNLDSVTFQGVEMAAGGWLTDTVFARFAYSFLDADEQLPGGGNRQLRSRPKHTTQTEFRYQLPRGILLSFNGLYLTGLYDLDPDGEYQRLSSFFVANVKARMSFSDNYEAYVAVSNVDDTNYQHRLGFPREGRAVSVGLNLEF